MGQTGGSNGGSRGLPPLNTSRRRCEFCGRFYSEQTAKAHARCLQEYDRRCAEDAGSLDV